MIYVWLQVLQLTVNCIRTKLKLLCLTNLESALLSPSPSLVRLCAGSDSINTLSWSQVNVNTSCACILVSKITYDAKNVCSDHGIWTWIWTLSLTFCLSDSFPLCGNHLSFKRNLLDLFWHDEDPWDLEYELLLDHDLCLHLLSLLGDLDQLRWSFFCFGVWDWDLCFFLGGGGGGSSFIFSFKGTFSSSEDSLSLLKLLDDDDESSDSGFITCCVDHFDLEEGPDKPSPAEPWGDLWTFLWLESAESCTGCLYFEEGLGGPSPAEPWGDLSTLLQLKPSGSFFDLASSDFFGVSTGVTSAVSWLFWLWHRPKYSSRLSSGGSILLDDVSFFFFLEP